MCHDDDTWQQVVRYEGSWSMVDPTWGCTTLMLIRCCAMDYRHGLGPGLMAPRQKPKPIVSPEPANQGLRHHYDPWLIWLCRWSIACSNAPVSPSLLPSAPKFLRTRWIFLEGPFSQGCFLAALTASLARAASPHFQPSS